ncbi:MAG: hypothetical protein WKF61_06125 [Luteimonas sp.]
MEESDLNLVAQMVGEPIGELHTEQLAILIAVVRALMAQSGFDQDKFKADLLSGMAGQDDAALVLVSAFRSLVTDLEPAQ